MDLWIFLPFEINHFNSSKTKNSIKNILYSDMDQTYLFDMNKKFRGNFYEHKIHLWDNIFSLHKKQHYYLEMVEKNDLVEIKIFSRSNFIYLIIYVTFMLAGIYGLITMILEINFSGILFVILWIIAVFIIGNLLWKKIREDTIKYLKERLS